MDEGPVDTSILLDLLLNRSPWAADMAEVWNAYRRGQIEAFLAAFAVPTVFYIIRRKTDLATARTAVADCLATLHIAPVDQTALLAAQAMPGSAFEGNLQIACAIHSRMDLIITRDPRGFAHSPLPVSTPTDLMTRLPGTPTP
jgi:predicted nucleic acid-binding protein